MEERKACNDEKLRIVAYIYRVILLAGVIVSAPLLDSGFRRNGV
jgi:hypothetical protein